MRKLFKSRIKLEHYSPTKGLKEISPKFQGSGADAQTQNRSSEHPHSFFYRSGSDLPQSDSHIQQGANSKYHIEIPEDAKLYDIGTDPEGHVKQLREQASSRQVNPGQISMDDVHGQLKNLGYHGFFHSTHPVQGMSNVVGLYHSTPVTLEEKIRE